MGMKLDNSCGSQATETSRGGQDSLNSLIYKNSIYLLIAKLTVPILSFLISIYIVRKLSVNEYGIYNLLIAVMGFIGLFSSMGLSSVFYRFIPEFKKNNQLANIKALVNKGLLYRFVVSSALILIMVLFADKLAGFFKIPNYLEYFKIFSLGLVFYFESELLETVFKSLFFHKYYTITQISYIFTRVSAIYFFLRSGYSLNGLLIGEVIGYSLMFILYGLFYYIKIGKTHTDNLSSSLPFRRLIRFGGFSYFNEMGSMVINVSTDYVVISAFLGPIAVGIYSFAYKVVEMLSQHMPHALLSEVIKPAFFARYIQNGDKKELERMFNLVAKFGAFFVFPLTIGIIVLGDKLVIYVFDPKYLNSLRLIWIMAVFKALDSFLLPIAFVIHSIEEVQILLYSKIFAIYNLILDLIVVRPYGILGVTLATCSADFMRYIFCYQYAKKYLNLNTDFKGLSIILFNSALMGLVLLSIRKFVTNIPSLVIATAIGVISYFLAAYFIKAFSIDERSIINKILPKPIFLF